MMLQKIGVDDVLGMFRSALDAGARQSRAVLGAAALHILAWLGFALALFVVLLVMGIAGAGEGGEAALRASIAAAGPMVMVVFMAVAFVLAPVLGGGMVQVMDNAEHGRARATDAFAGFRGDRFPPLAGLALFGMLGFGLSLLGQWVFGGAEYVAAQWNVWDDIAAGRTPQAVPAEHPLLQFFYGLGLGVVNGLVGLLMVPLVQLGGRGTMSAIVDSFRALGRNPGPMLLLAALGFAAVIASMIVLMVVVLVLVLLAMVLPWLAIPLLVLVMLAWFAGFTVAYYGLARAAWRRLFTDASAAAPAAEVAV